MYSSTSQTMQLLLPFPDIDSIKLMYTRITNTFSSTMNTHPRFPILFLPFTNNYECHVM